MNTATESNRSTLLKPVASRVRMSNSDIGVWVVIVVVTLASLLFWLGALVYGYVADDLSTTPADSRSVPAPRSY